MLNLIKTARRLATPHLNIGMRAFSDGPIKPKLFDASKSKYAIYKTKTDDKEAPSYLRNPRQVFDMVSKSHEMQNPEEIKARAASTRENEIRQKIKD